MTNHKDSVVKTNKRRLNSQRLRAMPRLIATGIDALASSGWLPGNCGFCTPKPGPHSIFFSQDLRSISAHNMDLRFVEFRQFWQYLAQRYPAFFAATGGTLRVTRTFNPTAFLALLQIRIKVASE